jgi:nucleotide-binding universal stress UspA family protein
VNQANKKGRANMNILVGYDGSKVAADALELAKKHAKAFDAKVFIVTSMVGGPEALREDFEKAEKDLNFAKIGFKKEEIPCETRLSVRGLEPGEDLVQFAEENKIDQIIVGIRRRSKVQKLVFGSNAQYVILEAPCPVLSVK